MVHKIAFMSIFLYFVIFLSFSSLNVSAVKFVIWLYNFAQTELVISIKGWLRWEIVHLSLTFFVTRIFLQPRFNARTLLLFLLHKLKVWNCVKVSRGRRDRQRQHRRARLQEVPRQGESTAYAFTPSHTHAHARTHTHIFLHLHRPQKKWALFVYNINTSYKRILNV